MAIGNNMELVNALLPVSRNKQYMFINWIQSTGETLVILRVLVGRW